MSDDSDYTNPQRGTSGRFLRREYGDPDTGQGSLELDVAGRGSTGFETRAELAKKTGEYTGLQDAISDGSGTAARGQISSRASKIGYDYGTGTLAVVFHKSGRNGPHYVFENVDPNLWETMSAGRTSIGKTIGRLGTETSYRPATAADSQYFG